MNRRILSLLLAFALLLGLLPTAVAAGPEDHRFLGHYEQQTEIPAGFTAIRSAADLTAVSSNLSGRYILMDDITLNPGWTSIGTEDTPFTGILDGNGYTISGLSQTWTADENSQLCLGLFGVLKGATVKNLNLSGQFTVDTDETYRDEYGWLYIGGIAGKAVSSVIQNCVNNVTITDDDLYYSYYHAMGGVVGRAEYSSIRYCRNLNSVYSRGEACSGIAGMAYHTTVHACRNDSSFHGGLNSGGIVGDCESSQVTSCANTAHLYVGDMGGGIVGKAYEESAISDCLNTGKIQLWEAGGGVPVSSGIVGGRSYERGEVTITRCVNTGTVERFAAIVCGTTPVVTDCFWLDTSARYMRFDTSGGQDTETGKLTADQMKAQESFSNFSFPQKWTLEEGMDCPFPTPLLIPEFENTYYTTYMEDTLASLGEGRFTTIMMGTGEGGLAGMLGKTYEDVKDNGFDKAWKAVNYLNSVLAFEGYEVTNDFDVILADVFSNAINSQDFQSILSDSYLDNFSSAVTALSFLYDTATAQVIQKKLESLAKLDDVFSAKAAGEIKEVQNLVKSSVKADGVGYTFMAVGSIVNLTGAAMTTAESAMAEIDRYVLCNAYVDAVEAYGQVLLDTAEQSRYISDNILNGAYLRSAANDLVTQMNAYAQANFTALLEACGGKLLNMAAPTMNVLVDGIYWNMAEICPLFAGIKTGISMGKLVGDAFTNADDIQYYGKMMHMAGYLAKAMSRVVQARQTALMESDSYQDYENLNVALDLYLSLQILACRYGIGYCNAMASAALARATPAFNINMEYAACAIQLQALQAELLALQENGKNITLGPDGSIHGFIAQCPVTVIVETKDGTEIARLSTGEKSVNSTCNDIFFLLDQTWGTKAGFYDPAQHNLRILGDGTGTMDLTLFSGTRDNLIHHQVFLDLPVSPGDEYVPSSDGISLNGTDQFSPDSTYTLPPLEAVWKDGVIQLTNLPADLVVMIAAYDSSGKMTDIQVVESPSASVPVTVSGEKITAFFLNGSSIPLREPLPIQ